MIRFFSTIGGRMLILVGGVILLNVVTMVAFYTKSQEQSILSQNEANMGKMAEAVSHGLQSVMLGGYADIAHAYADGLKRVRDVEDFRILRMDGNEAFQDNKTIHDVNTRMGSDEFQPRKEERAVPVLARDDANLKKVLQDKKTSILYHGGDNKEKKLTFLLPILAEKSCYRCHGKENPVRGILKLTTSLASVHEAIRATRIQATMILAASILGSLLVVGFLIRYSLVRPIDRVTSAMAKVAQGDFSQQVPVMGMQELERMASSFNVMTREVLEGYSHLTEEQNKLTTIILSAREAIVVSNAAGVVVIVNPAAERILEKSDRELIEGGFLAVVDDPAYVRAFLDKNGADMPDTLVYKDRILNFYAATIQNKQGVTIGSAALIRDITEEKRLEEALRLMSYTDKLTGLYNRRRLEELLSGEYNRARRYSLSLSVLFFDVDHFKKFNDTYGHDMGDKVLEVIGHVAKSHFRTMDYACRYGGEEFCIILPNTDEEGAFSSADRFRERLENTDISGMRVTCSIGVATFPEAAGEKWDEFLKLADNALYEAKRQGRNRVVQWRAGMTGKGVQ
ncbi:MAG: diguanylate cyclase [Magnetococcus sp. DMHC-1]|nr:diguanylate cyclase [Magnetococcales bacterium]